MRTKVEIISFEQVIATLRNQQFDVQEVSGVANPELRGLSATDREVQISGTAPGITSAPILLKKYGAGAILARRTGSASSPRALPRPVPQHPAVWIHPAGFLVRGEIAVLLDRGYQKFWISKDLEIPATAASLHAVHRFEEEVREAIGEPDLYNEALGTTSDLHFYDRVQGRDLPVSERPTPAWALPPEKSSPGGGKEEKIG